MTRDCAFLNPEKSSLLRQLIIFEISEGIHKPSEIVKNVYKNLSQLGVNEDEKALYVKSAANAIPVIQGIFARNDKDTYRKLVSHAEEQINLIEQIDSAEKVLDFIESFGKEFTDAVEQVVSPVVTQAANAPSQPEDIESEEESKHPQDEIDPEMADELAEQELFDKQESRPVSEIKSYIAKNDQGSNANWIKSLFQAGPVAILQSGVEFEFRIQDDGQVHQLYRGASIKSMSLDQFMDVYNGASIIKNRFENLDPHRNSEVEGALQQKEQAQKFEWMGRGISKMFTNAVHATERTINLFTNENGKFVVGPLAESWKRKTDLLKRIDFGMKKSGSFSLDKQTLKGGKLFVEISQDDSITYPLAGQEFKQLLLVQEDKDGNKTVVGNFYPPSDKDLPKGPEAENLGKYTLLFKALYGKVGQAGNKLDITENGVLFKELFQPAQARYNQNLIFSQDKDRHSKKGADKDKAQKLTLKNFRQLLGAMGYGISRVHINTLPSELDINSSRAMIAVSPFHTAEQIDSILQNDIVWNESEALLSKIGKEHGISFLYLQRKELDLNDYIRLTAGNKTTVYRKDGELDFNKRQAIFNLGQSPYLHYKVASLIPEIEKNLDKLSAEEKDDAKQTIQMIKAFLFSGKHKYSDSEADRKNNDRINSFFKKIKSADQDQEAILGKFFKEIDSNYQAWQDITDSVERMELSKRYARKLFGYVSKHSTDPLDREFYKQKAALKKYENGKSNPDTDGGIYGDSVLDFFALASKVQAKGVKLSQTWDKTGAEERKDKRIVSPKTTFNPTVDSSARQPFRDKGINLAPAGMILPGVDSGEGDRDVSDDYYMVEHMPLAPHAGADIEKLNESLGVKIESGNDFGDHKKTSGRRKRKEVSSTKGIDFNLSQQEATKLYNYLLGDIQGELRFRNSLIKGEKNFAVGQVYKGMMELYSENGKVSDRVLRHEVFHRLLNEVLAPAEYNAVLDAAAKMFPESVNPEESLATFYDENVERFQLKAIGKLPKVIQDLFFMLRKLYLQMRNMYNEVDFVLEKLESGNFRNAPLQYNHYDGTVRNKEYSVPFDQLSTYFSKDADENIRLRDGEAELQFILVDFRSRILNHLYGNQNRLDQSLKSFPDALKDYRESLRKAVLNDPMMAGKSMNDIHEEVLSWTKDELKDDDTMDFFLMYQRYYYFDNIKEYAFDFYNFNDTSDEDYELELDQDADDDTDSEDTSTDDKLKRFGDRSLLSAVSALNKKVKFHLFNQIITHNGEEQAIDAVKVTRLLKNLSIGVTQDKKNAKAQFSSVDFLNAYRDYLSKLKNVDTSLEYVTAKALWEKFFNPDNAGSYMSISMLDVPVNSMAYLHKQRHQNVLNGILSSFKSIVVQEFLMPTVTNFGTVKIKTTDTSSQKSIKNNYNETIINKLFFKKEENGNTSFALQQEVIDTLLSGGNEFEITSEGSVLSMLINGTRISVPSSALSISSGKLYDLKDAHKKTIAATLNADDIFRFFKAAGIPVTQKGVDMYILEGQGNKAKLADIAVQTYAMIARQAAEEGRFNLGEEGLETLKKFTNGKTDEPSKVLREGLQESKTSATSLQEEGELAKTENSTVYSPTRFFWLWKEIAAADAFFGSEAASAHQYILNKKHNKDKFPTALRRRIDWLKDVPLRLQSMASQAMEKTALSKQEMDSYLAENFPWYSGNKFLNGDVKIKGMFYFNHAENIGTGRGVDLLGMKEKEFQRLLLGMIGSEEAFDNESKSYLHPVDIQADRGYLPTVELDKFYQKEADQKKGVSEIHAYFPKVASQLLKEIQDATGLKTATESTDSKELIQKFKQAEALLKKKPELLNKLQLNKHYQMVKGVPVMHQYVQRMLETTQEEFAAKVEDSFLRYAQYIQQIGLSDHNGFRFKALENSKTYAEINKGFSNKYGQISLVKKDIDFSDPKNAAKDIHPALRAIYHTYYINNFHLSQMLSGNFFFFKGDGPIAIDAGYMTDYSKRQTGNGTSMIEPVFREVMPDGTVFNENGLDYEANFMNVADFEYDWNSPESADFVKDFYGALPEKTDSIKVHDGIQFYLPLFTKLYRNSMGNEDGFPIGNVIKSIHFNHNLKNGSVDYFKGLGMEINSSMLDLGEPVLHNMHRAAYEKGIIGTQDGQQTLWDVYEQTLASTGNRNMAEEAVYEAFIEARKTGNLIQAPAMLLNTKSASKGAVRNMNELPVDAPFADPKMDQTSMEGFGAVMDLQKNIDKADTDVALSMQMMYLLGINGNNYQRAFTLYQKLAELTGLDSRKIKKEIKKITAEGDEGAGFRRWSLKEIAKGFQNTNDFGLQYKLSTGEAAVLSNPMLFNQFFAKVGSKISKAIQQRGFGYKALQLPGYNLIKMFEVNGKMHTRKDLARMGVDPMSVQGRNLKFAHTNESTIAPAEVIAGNHLKTRFGLGDASLREIFSIKVGEKVYDLEAENYEALPEYKKAVENDLNETFDFIEWQKHPVIKGLALDYRKKDKGDLFELIYKGYEIDPLQRAEAIAEIAGRLYDINRSLYGVFSRIPGTGKNSSSSFRIVAFENSYKNGVFVPAEWLHVSGSDHDGDTLQVWLPNVGGGTEAELNNYLLDFARQVLTDKANKEEIFSPIELDYIEKEVAGEQRNKELAEGKEMRANDLYSQGKILQNNGAGTTMTGLNALLGKVFSYTIQAKQHLLDDVAALQDEGLSKDIQENLSAVMAIPSVSGIEQSPGILSEKDADGQYIYKWIETLINSAVDNAKILGLGYIKLDKYTSDIQAAMTFMGYSKRTIVNFLTHPNVVKVVDHAKNADDITNSYASDVRRVLGSKPFSMKADVADSILVGSTPNLDDESYAQALLFKFVTIGQEYSKLNNALKVTYPVKGVPDQQETQISQILSGLGFTTARSAQKFLSTVEQSEAKGKSLLQIPKIRKSVLQSSIFSPLYMVMKLPHLREYLKKHLFFENQKENHLMFQEHVRKFQNALKRMINYRDIRKGSGKHALQNAVDGFLSAKYFEQGRSGQPISVTLGESAYNLGIVEDRNRFIKDFSRHVQDLKLSGMDNLFIQNLEVVGQDIRYRYSDKLQKEEKVIPANEFDRMGYENKDLQQKFFYYQLATKGLRFHKDSMIHFFNGQVFEEYNRFLSVFETDSSKLMDQKEGNTLIENFLITHPQFVKPISSGWLAQDEINTARKDGSFVIANKVDEIKNRYEVAKGKRIDRYFKTEVSAEDKAALSSIRSQIRELEQFGEDEENQYRIEELVEEMRAIEEGAVDSASLPMFAGIHYFDRDNDQSYRFLYKYTEEGGKPYYERVFSPHNADSLAYSTQKALPVVKERNSVLQLDPTESITERAASLADGDYITNKGFGIEVAEGKIKKKTQYNISGKGKAIGQDMARALAGKIQEVFPGVQVKFVRNAKGIKAQASGWTENGIVYLNLDKVTADTPLHEFGHVLLSALKQSEPALYERILQMTSESGLLESIDPLYRVLYKNDSEALLEEAFNQMLGLSQEGKLLAMLNETSGDPSGIAELIKKFWKAIQEMLGLAFDKEVDLNKAQTLEELFDIIGTAVVKGEVLYRGKAENAPAKLSARQLQRIKKQLTETGQLKNRCS